LQAARRRRHYPGGLWRYVSGGVAFAVAGAYMESTDVPGYLHPVQAVFAAMLPLAVMDALSTSAATFLNERRAARRRAARPRVTFALLAVGWALIAAACGLLAWAAGHGWVETGLIWATVICACAAVMTIGRAVPSPSRRTDLSPSPRALPG
jgi:hypothetical protein